MLLVACILYFLRVLLFLTTADVDQSPNGVRVKEEPGESLSQAFDYLSQYYPWNKADLGVIEAASTKRRRDEDGLWLARYGLDPDVWEAMAAASDRMTDESRAKRARSEEIQQEREALLAKEQDPFKQMMMKHVWKTEDSHADLISITEASRKDVGRIDVTLKQHGERMDRFEAKTELLEKQLQQIREGSGAGSTSTTASGAGGGGGGGPPGGGGGGGYSRGSNSYFNPSYVEMKGWVTDWNDQILRGSQMLPWADVEQLIKNLLETLPVDDEIRSKYDEAKTIRLNGGRYMFGNIRIGFQDGTQREVLWKFKKWIDSIVVPTADRPQPPPGLTVPDAQTLIQNLGTALDPHRIRTTVEAPPWKKDHVQAVGRFYGAWKSQTSTLVAIDVRGELGPPRSQMWTKSTQNCAPMCLATFTTVTGLWTIHAATWARLVQLYPALTVQMDQVQAEANRRM